MSYTGNKVLNIFINSANRSLVDKSYDFNIYFDNDEINVNPNVPRGGRRGFDPRQLRRTKRAFFPPLAI